MTAIDPLPLRHIVKQESFYFFAGDTDVNRCSYFGGGKVPICRYIIFPGTFFPSRDCAKINCSR